MSRAPSRAPAPRRSRPDDLRLGSPRPRLRMLSLGLTLVMLVFAVRLVHVQVVDAAAYTEQASSNRYVTVPLAAQRGDITDRNGTALATTVDAYDIIADPTLFTRDITGVDDAPEQAAALLAPVLGEDEEELAALLATPDSQYVLLARQQTPQAWRQITDLRRALAERADAGTGHQVLTGVFREPNPKRVYPGGDLAAGVLGFVNNEGRGGAGIEAQFDRELAGQDGAIRYAQSGGRRVPTAGSHEQPPVPGTDLELTIDRDIQWAAQRAIEAQVAESVADGGYVVVQDARSGEVLAMASAPGFDPNDYAATDPALLGNPALQDAYEPGSTSKVISMAAVLQEGVAGTGTHVTVPNRLPRADRAFADDHEHDTLHLTLAGVLARSSNIGTILAVELLGDTQSEANEVLHSYLTAFGFGRPTGLGFPGETAGILADPGDWNASQQYTVAFGQGLSVNAVQAASVYSTVANGGVRIAPTLIRGTTGADGRYEPWPRPEPERVIDEATADDLTAMLETVVADDELGTGRIARIDGYRVAGKTGTSNRVDPGTGRYRGYTSSFAGFAPADDPRITVYCAVQNPTEGPHSGSQVCGPVFKEVMEFSLKSLRVPPTGAEVRSLPATFDPGDSATADAAAGGDASRRETDPEE
ncbi:peptidoglycan D,D-transpeptidase FtsI family protein [Streptomyces aidingensis]|uniref:Cell division protein FtsI (Penicillin-binding protein 3) n=1 Tax=Streptomyces aidingensis TaxID=910347 RepID=A0A1I1LLG9_9ACTN|nr:penicillin-binding protein 2 [Streptomyces aidingensis]SFC73402.1 cell division protein FtsI (penicillin-binding protein 3) [Streptomyces aidingensis]